MKITNITCYVVEGINETPSFHWREGIVSGSRQGSKSYGGLLRIDTDEGLVGVAGGGNGYALAEMTEKYLRDAYVGRNPLLTEALWHTQWELHRSGVRLLGAIDIACWDIKSQAAGLPLYKLLGGNNPRVPAYASTVTWDTMDEYEQHIKECMDEGFFAFKLHASGDARWDAELSHNLRAWTGDEADLMFDGSAGWDFVTSLWFGHALEDAGFLWYEEPMREYDLPSYAQLCADLDIPVLGAETSEGVHWNAATWIRQRALDMVRTNVGSKAGFTGALKIAHLAESFGMRAQVHGMGWHNAQLCAAIPNNDYYEQLVINSEQIAGLKEMGPLSIVDGYITASEEPGMGPHPDWRDLERRAVLVV
jgi:L-alanine-DL-glutamate epimerase-like enolase superfamily enzyme